MKFLYYAFIAIVLFTAGCDIARADVLIDTDVLMEAIYRAEGGKNAKKPYGILSIPCEGKEHCGRICRNTINNNLKRYAKSTSKGSTMGYIAFLGSRYAPTGKSVANDPLGLNNHWVGNVSSIYFKLLRGK